MKNHVFLMTVVITTMTSAFFYDGKKQEPLNVDSRGVQCKLMLW